jgi:hypothetical protein
MTNENPVDYLIRRCGMTRIAFTREYGFGENHLLLVAQGRKESVSPKLKAALLDLCQKRGLHMDDELQRQYATDSIDDAFENWRTDQRWLARLPDRVMPGLGSPMARIVKHFGSIAQTAKALRVRDIHVRTYMESDRMPSPLFEAISETRWGRPGAEALVTQQTRYFKDKGRKR